MDDVDKTWLHELMMDESGQIFQGREALSSHFAGLNDGDKADIQQGIQTKFPNLFWEKEHARVVWTVSFAKCTSVREF